MHKPVESALSPFGTCRAHSLARSFFAQKALYWFKNEQMNCHWSRYKSHWPLWSTITLRAAHTASPLPQASVRACPLAITTAMPQKLQVTPMTRGARPRWHQLTAADDVSRVRRSAALRYVRRRAAEVSGGPPGHLHRRGGGGGG